MPQDDKQRNQIRVFLWGTEIGALTWVNERNSGYFHFSPQYFNMPYDICPIVSPKNEPKSRHAIYGTSSMEPGNEGKIYQGLPPFLADSLPDQWGNIVFDQWFESHGLPNRLKTSLTKLSFIGNRAMGAFEFRPMMAPGFYEDKAVNLSELFKESLIVENNLKMKKVLSGEATIDDIAALGTPPGGSRNKALFAISKDGTFHTGAIPLDPSWKQCIIKFNAKNLTLCEIEKVYYELARASKIKMMPSWLMEIDGLKHFVTERYDRKEGKKVFTQTLAAINPEARTYEDLFRTCRRLGVDNSELRQLYRQMVFNFLLNNTDDHRKNFSFLMDENYQWHLTPAYDLTFMIKEEGNAPEVNHCMSILGKINDVTEADLIEFAARNDIHCPQRIINDIRSASLRFEDLAIQYGVSGYFREMISSRLNQLGRPNHPVHVVDESISVDEAQNQHQF